MTGERALLDLSTGWTARDYVSPGLHRVTPDAAFPGMRPGNVADHPWKYLRRDVPHVWYVDGRYPLMGFLGRDEATLLYNIALQFAGQAALEIGGWLGWSTCHLALAGVALDTVDPAHDEPSVRALVESSLSACGIRDRVRLAGGRSPDAIATLGRRWSLFFIDGDHEPPAPVRDTLACLPYAADDCAFVFHDVASPAVSAAVRLLADRGFHVVVYQTAQMMALAWRGNVQPPDHVPDPEVAWQVPTHLRGLPIAGVDFEPPPRSTYPRLRDLVTPIRHHGTAPPAARPTVCVVTSELIGLFRNGGIGTATTGLAELLAADGLRVTVLYTGALLAVDGMHRWRAHYRAQGIELHALELAQFNTLAGPAKDHGFGVPWLVFEYLAEHRFDVVHFNDCAGEGSLALVAKRLGVAFDDALLVVALHSPSRWVLELNQTLPSTLILAAFHSAEHLAIAAADLLWCPSRYLLDWVAAREFRLPQQTCIQPYALPLPRSIGQGDQDGARTPFAAPAPGRRDRPTEIVFFGRLEERKGLRVFCTAVHLLRDRLASDGITITFLGKPERCGGMPSLEFIGERAARWPFPVRTVTDLGQPEAIQYLVAGNRLAVMASPFDNSPCTVYEALAWGIPFLAARTGGIPELIDAADHDRVLFANSARALAGALTCVLDDGGWVARPSITQEDVRRTWREFHDDWRRFLPPPRVSAPSRTLALLIDHRAGDRLSETLDVIGRCTEIVRVIVFNRSGEQLDVPNVDLLAGDVGGVEEALAAIQEDAVLLVHSGVRVVPQALTAMVQALWAANLDGLMPAGRLIGDRRSRIVQPLGGSAPFGLFEGATYTGALLLTREAVDSARRGQALAIDVPFAGVADLCIAAGRTIWPYPVAVVERPEALALALGRESPARVAWYAGDATDRYYMMAAGYAATRGAQLTSRMSVAIAAAEIGLAPAIRTAMQGLRRLRRWFRR